MYFEDRQIVAGPIDCDLPVFGFSLAVVGAVFPAQNRGQTLHIEAASVSIDQGFDHLTHFGAFLEQQIAAVLQLVDRILVPEPARAQERNDSQMRRASPSALRSKHDVLGGHASSTAGDVLSPWNEAL